MENSFGYIRQTNPQWGDYICLAVSVKGKKESKRALLHKLKKYVSKDDYQTSDTKKLITHLFDLSQNYEADK